MKDEIARASARIRCCYNEIRNLEDFIKSAQKICSHDWKDAPELFDYHNRVEYSRCDICGLVR